MMCESGKKCCTPHWLGWVLVLIGALNWGLVGIGYFYSGMDWNLVKMLLGSWPMVENIVYILVGLSALLLLKGCKCNQCMGGEMMNK